MLGLWREDELLAKDEVGGLLGNCLADEKARQEKKLSDANHSRVFNRNRKIIRIVVS